MTVNEFLKKYDFKEIAENDAVKYFEGNSVKLGLWVIEHEDGSMNIAYPAVVTLADDKKPFLLSDNLVYELLCKLKKNG